MNKASLNRVNQEKDIANGTCQQLKRDLDHSYQDMNAMKENLEKLTVTLDMTIEEKAIVESQLSEMSKKRDELEADLIQKSNELASEKENSLSSKGLLETKIQDLLGEISAKQVELEDDRSQSAKEVQTMQNSISSLEEEIIEKQKEIQNISERLHTTQNQLNERESDVVSLRSKLKDVAMEFEKEHETLQQTINGKNEAINQISEILFSKENELAYLENCQAESKEVETVLLEEKVCLLQQLSELLQELEQANKNNLSKTSENEALAKSLEECRQQMEVTENELGFVTEKLREMEAETSNLLRTAESRNQTLSDMEEEKRLLQSNYDALSEKFARTESQVEDFIKQLEQCSKSASFHRRQFF